MSRYFNAYRLASYTLVLYTFGHTVGAVIRTPDFGVESTHVATTMKTVHVVAEGADRTWYDFYRGFGIFVSLFFILSVFMTFYIGGKTAAERRALLPLTCGLGVCYGVSIVIACAYFFAMPIMFSTAVTLLLAVAAARDARGLTLASSISGAPPR